MKLPQPTPRYDPAFQRILHNQLEQADDMNRKKQVDIDVYPGRLILRSPNGTRYSLTVSDAGALAAVVLP